MKRLCSVIAALCCTAAISQAATFSENFDDGNAFIRWSSPTVDSDIGTFDGTVNYAFDYGALGVPAAPGGGDTLGLFFEANKTDDVTGDEGEAIAVQSLLATMPAGDFKLSMDVYYIVDNNAGGTTEFGIFGVYTSGANDPGDASILDDVPFDFSVSNGDGLAWDATGEGGATNDFNRYEDAGNADAGTQTSLGGYDDIPEGSIPGVSTGDGSADPFSFGPANRWVDVSIESNGGIVSFLMNGFEIDSFDNTAGTFSGGSIMLGYADYFNSTANPALGTDPFPSIAQAIIYDNVVLEEVIDPNGLVPEPTTGLLVGLFSAILAVTSGRKRAA